MNFLIRTINVQMVIAIVLASLISSHVLLGGDLESINSYFGNFQSAISTFSSKCDSKKIKMIIKNLWGLFEPQTPLESEYFRLLWINEDGVTKFVRVEADGPAKFTCITSDRFANMISEQASHDMTNKTKSFQFDGKITVGSINKDSWTEVKRICMARQFHSSISSDTDLTGKVTQGRLCIFDGYINGSYICYFSKLKSTNDETEKIGFILTVDEIMKTFAKLDSEMSSEQ